MRKTLYLNRILAIVLVFVVLASNRVFAETNDYTLKVENIVAFDSNKAGGYKDVLNGFTMSDWAEEEVKKSIDMNIFYKGLDKDLKQNINREDFAVISVLILSENYGLPKDAFIESSFSDIDKNADTYDYISSAKQYRIVEGVSETEFAPYRNIKRKEALVMLYRIYKYYEKGEAKITNANKVEKFKDSKDYKYLENWAKDAVVYFIGAGILQGYGNGEYGLNDKITSEQALALAARYVDYLRSLSGGTAYEISENPIPMGTESLEKKNLFGKGRFTDEEYKDMIAYLDFVNKHPIKNKLEVYSVVPSKGGANGRVGVLNDDTRIDFINSINRIRLAAKVPLIELDNKLMKKAQHGAYLMYETKQYGHHLERKGADWNLYKIGSQAASESNIGYNTSPSANVDWFVTLCTLDNTAKNIPKLGHRRWNINPNMKYTGIGVARPYFVQYAFDMSRSPKVSPDYVAYPSKGAFPLELIEDAPWSLELGRDYSGGGKKYKLDDKRTPKVTLTRLSDNKSEVFWKKSSQYNGGKFFNVNTDGYGYGNAIIFKPTIKVKALERYRVKVENIIDVKTSKPTQIVYEVIFY